MKTFQAQPKKYFSSILGLVLLLTVWMTLTPAQFGGRAVYLVISGVSMEPTFHDGDLVVLHQTDTYQNGDIAAYYHPMADGIVIHRIVGQENGRYILLGDNKPKVDAYQPTPGDMVGKFWLHIPMVGTFINSLKSLGFLTPGVIITVMAVLLVPSLVTGQKEKQQSRQKYSRPKQESKPAMDQGSLSKFNKTDVIIFLAAVAAASLALAFLGFRQPASIVGSSDVSYQQHGTFNYSADAPPGVYDADTVQTGKPIFRALIKQMTVTFDYQFSSDQPGTVAGTYKLLAQLSHPNGWDWTIELLPETPFQGDSFSVSSDIDLSQVQTLVDSLEQQTGLQGQRYKLDIVPQVIVKGTVDGQPFQDEFAPRLAFNFDQIQMQLADSSPGSVNAPPEDPLAPTQTGTVSTPVEVPNKISLLGFTLTVATIRQIAVIGLIFSLGGLLVLGFFMLGAQKEDEIARIQFKYGSHIINVQETELPSAEQVINVSAIEDLVNLAERNGGMILHYTHTSAHQYLIKVADVIYSYRIDPQQVETKTSMPEG